MADIDIRRSHQLTPELLRLRMGEIADSLAQKYAVDYKWVNEDHVSITRKGVKGKILLDPSHVSIDLQLGLVLKPLRSRIQASIERRLDELLRA